MQKPLERPNTTRTYSSLYNNWIKGKTIDELVSQVVYSNKIKPRTKLAILRVLKKTEPKIYNCWDFGTAAKFIAKAQNPDPIKSLTKIEASKIMAICHKKYPAFYPILLLALHGGLRRGEVFGLRWKAVDFLHNRIYINHSYDGPTKNGKSRVIPLSKELEKSLLNCYNLTEGGNDKLFSVINPNPILEAICREASVRRVTFHQLRHTFATLCLEQGTSPKVVSDLLGHSNVSTTLDLYWSNITKDYSFINKLYA
jgi:integrase